MRKVSKFLFYSLLLITAFFSSEILLGEENKKPNKNARLPKDDTELRSWLENMVWHHRYSQAEINAATGVPKDKISAALKKWKINAKTKPPRKKGTPLLVLPYPGGRHPRIGFLDGAIDPQRETKISVFTPWDDSSYVVVDVPEAIWSNLGLTYLAHTHVPTIWSKQGVKLKPLEWKKNDGGSFVVERKLPNGIRFKTEIKPKKDSVRMSIKLTNGTKNKLTGLRVQNCVMLKGARGFTQQNNRNKIFAKPYGVAHDKRKKRWIITAWTPEDRSWANEKCPCLHSDPKFPDAEAGKNGYNNRVAFFL